MLHWADIDVDARTMVVHEEVRRVTGEGVVFQEPKSEEGRRTIKLPAFLVAVLRGHKAKQDAARLAAGPRGATRGWSSARAPAGRSTGRT